MGLAGWGWLVYARSQKDRAALAWMALPFIIVAANYLSESFGTSVVPDDEAIGFITIGLSVGIVLLLIAYKGRKHGGN